MTHPNLNLNRKKKFDSLKGQARKELCTSLIIAKLQIHLSLNLNNYVDEPIICEIAKSHQSHCGLIIELV